MQMFLISIIGHFLRPRDKIKTSAFFMKNILSYYVQDLLRTDEDEEVESAKIELPTKDEKGESEVEKFLNCINK